MDSTEKQYQYDTDLKLTRFVDSFRHGLEIYYKMTLHNLPEEDQHLSRKTIMTEVLPRLLRDPNNFTDEVRLEIANGNFSALNELGLIWMMGYSSTSADFGVDQKMPGELVEEVNKEYSLTFRGGGRWI